MQRWKRRNCQNVLLRLEISALVLYSMKANNSKKRLIVSDHGRQQFLASKIIITKALKRLSSQLRTSEDKSNFVDKGKPGKVNYSQ
jgi:hypothetical protein